MTRAGQTRILYVVNRPEFFLSHRLPLAAAARSAGYDVTIATPHNEHVSRIHDEGFPWYEIKLAPGGRSVSGEIRTLASLVRCYRRLRPDLVHQITIKPVLYGTLAARLTRVPAVVNAMPGLGYTFSAEAGYLGTIVRSAFRVAVRHPRMRFIFQNADDRSLFIASRWSSAEQAVLIPGSGVDPDLFSPGSKEPEDAAIVMFAGRLLSSKGLPEFVEAARRLRGRARFVIVGDVDRHRPDSVSPDDLTRWRTEGVIEVWGPRDDMPEVLRQAAIFCLPSYMPEGVPKALLEAAAVGLPIVTTNTPGCRDVVIDGDNGLLVPPRDAGALAAAIERLISDPGLRRTMGARGRNRVIEHFTIDRVVSDTLRLYENLLHAATDRPQARPAATAS